MEYSQLSSEQQNFVNVALQGYNVLVDACIGSGKTTAIQVLCNMIPVEKQVLYLTYNRLLKLDAKNKINNYNVFVQNYHGWAYCELVKNGIRSGISDILTLYNKYNLPVSKVDVLILDEYQDIEQDIADMLEHIKLYNPSMQIIAVGDMAQKIYDKTTLNVGDFMSKFLGACYKLEFTQCFRLCVPLAHVLGTVWGKEIVGVNDDCKLSYMNFDEIVDYVQTCDPKDILCLGSANGLRNKLLNVLESECPSKFNKHTVYSKIRENDQELVAPGPDVGIFTTYDGCKGMERDVCILFDWTMDYWYIRLNQPDARYEIIRNIFCVAASRGKKHIIFCVRKRKDHPLDFKTMMYNPGENLNIRDMEMSKMFDFKYVEDVNDAYNCLDVREIQSCQDNIEVDIKDGLIDLSPCVGIYQEVAYFKSTNIDNYIRMYFAANPDDDYKEIEGWESWNLKSKVLYFTSLETKQDRYLYQVQKDFITEQSWNKLQSRLSSRLSSDEISQVKTDVKFFDKGVLRFSAVGFCDVIKDDVVYEFKFVSELSHVHCLQLAMYLIGLKKEKGVLWNVRTNQMFEICIPDRKRFLDCVVKAATKGRICVYQGDVVKLVVESKTPVTEPFGVVSEGGNKKAFNYQQKCVDFVHDNLKVCYNLAIEYLTSVFLDEKYNGSRVERYFRERNIGMNMSGKTFLKYFGYAMRENCDFLDENKQYNLKEFFEKCYPEL